MFGRLMVPFPEAPVDERALAYGQAAHAKSPTEQLVDTIQAHTVAEEESLATYRGLVEATEDPVVGLLMQLLLDDEQRHHTLLARMAASLQDDLAWTHSPTALPSGQAPRRAAKAEVLAATRTRLREEQESVGRLRKLAREWRQLHDGLHPLLLEVIARDSEKHAHILKFILKRLQAR